MSLRRLLCLFILAASLSPPAFAQQQASGAITSTQCVTIAATQQSTVGIQVSGTWTGTLVAQVSVQGQPAVVLLVVPSTSSTPQATITGNGFYQAKVAGASTFLVCGNTVASGSAAVYLNASTAVAVITPPASGSGDVISSPAQQVAFYPASAASVQGTSHLTDDGTTIAVTGPGGLNVNTGGGAGSPITSTGFGTLAALPAATSGIGFGPGGVLNGNINSGGWFPILLASTNTLGANQTFFNFNDLIGGTDIFSISTVSGPGRLHLCGTNGPQSFWMVGNTIPCSTITTSPQANFNIEIATGSSTHNAMRLYASPAAYTGTLLEFNAEASGTLFNHWVANAGVTGPSGTVNTSGTAVTWASGATFSTAWTGRVIINAVTYTISSCASTTACTLTTSAGTQSGVAYNFPDGSALGGTAVASLRSDGQVSAVGLTVGAHGITTPWPSEIHSASFPGGTLADVLAGCPATPATCRVVLDPNNTAMTVAASSYPVIIGSTTQVVTVENHGQPLSCSGNHASVPCIAIEQNGALTCPKKGNTGLGCAISGTSTAQFLAYVMNNRTDGLQTDFTFSGHTFTSNTAAVITLGYLAIVSVEGKGRVSDISMQGIDNTVDLYLADSSSGGGDNNNIIFTNNAFYCGGHTGCISIRILGPTGTGTGGGTGYYFYSTNVGDGLMCGGASPCGGFPNGTCWDGNGCLIDIDGSGHGATSGVVHAIKFSGLYMEGQTSQPNTAHYVAAQNVQDLDMEPFVVNAGPAVTDCVVIQHSASSRTGRVHIAGRDIGGRCTHTVNNLITGVETAHLIDMDYTYPGDSAAPSSVAMVDGTFSASGYQINNAATNGHCLVGNGTVFTDTACPSSGAISVWYSPSVGTSALTAVAQNTTQVWALYIPAPITSVGFCLDAQTADNTANVYDIGIYDSTGTLDVHLGATAGTSLFASTGIKCRTWTASGPIPAGLAALAITSSAAAPAAKLGGTPTAAGVAFATVSATGGTTSGGVLNNSITFPTTNWIQGEIPNLQLH